jgi:hypothetical protein
MPTDQAREVLAGMSGKIDPVLVGAFDPIAVAC